MKKLLKTDLLFTAADDKIREGFVLIEGNRIAKVGEIAELSEYVDSNTEVLDFYGKVVTPGFVDNHVFFTGYIWERIGFDASAIEDEEGLIERIVIEAGELPDGRAILGHGLRGDLEFPGEKLNSLFPDRPVMVFNEAREWCFMNRAAEEKYHFSGEECWAEKCWILFKEILSDKDFAKAQYLEFQDLLASKGITGIKEIGFDDYYGFTKVLKELEDENALKHRVNLVSQPVGKDADFSYGQSCRELFDGDQVRFMGFNIMVDGDIESGDGDLLDEYKNNTGMHCGMDIDYDAIEKTVLEADRQGFRCALHAEGDAAVRRCIDIYEKCRLKNGDRDARHAIVDMELIDPKDRKRLSELNISAIQYIQIMNCYGSRENYWDEKILSVERQKTIWAYKSILEDECRLCFGTDLPLDVPDIPLSIKFGVFRRFPDGTPEGGYHSEEALTPGQVLICWSKNGQEANFEEDRLGTLEEGKLADIAVIDTNVFSCTLSELEKAEVCMTIYNGEIVYTK
ncbi:MAG: amidohydrolase family protein [Clostridiales bacterium]|nr:amidohydrolase family protein [Clostridiales bacterium]